MLAYVIPDAEVIGTTVLPRERLALRDFEVQNMGELGDQESFFRSGGGGGGQLAEDST